MDTTIQANTTKTASSTINIARARPTAGRPTTGRPTSPAEPTPDHDSELLVKRPASEITRLVFMALLGCAACLALVGVVSQAGDPGTSPDDPAPAVIIN